jgi:hypothetical protein
MKEVIRRGIFETNSSSVHSITMCSDDEYSTWENDEVYYDRWDYKFVDKSEEIEREREEDGRCTRYLTYDEFYDCDYLDYETFDNEYTTESGETVHAFGYYGYN